MKGFKKIICLSMTFSLMCGSMTAYAENSSIRDIIEQLKSEGKELISLEEFTDIEMKRDTVIHTDEEGNQYIEVIATISYEATNWEHIPLTYEYEIAWTKLHGIVNDWRKVEAINGEMVTPESGWYPLVQYYIENNISGEVGGWYYNSGDINFDGAIDLTDLTELSLALIGDKTLEGMVYMSADIDGNGELNIADLAHLKQYIMGEDVKLG